MDCKKIVLVLFTILMIGQSQASWCLGTPVPIVNPGFESSSSSSIAPGVFPSADGWTTVGQGGIWNVNAYPYGYYPANAAPEGNSVGWTHGSMSQVLTTNLQSGNTYTLTGMVGAPGAINGNYRVDLLAGSNVLATTSGTPPPASCAPFPLTCTDGSFYVGLPLTIHLVCQGTETDFDKISLISSPPQSSSVPVMEGMWLLPALLAGVGLFARRRKE